MTNLEQFLNQLSSPAYIGIALLMLSTFILGYVFGSYGMKAIKNAKITALKNQINAFKISEKAKNLDTIYTEVKPKIIQAVRDQQSEVKSSITSKTKIVVEPDSIISKTRSNFVNYSINSPSLDFESIGYANKNKKDQLTLINGIGPYIEQKLNEIGIYNFDQISRLQIKDIRILTTLIDFFPGRIERDNWVAQAKELTLIKD